MAKDPICGMYVDEKTGLKKEVGGKTYYFCAESCMRAFVDPENELKRMKKRVTVALTGVMLLAALRVLAIFTLAAGVSIISWAPIPSLSVVYLGLLVVYFDHTSGNHRRMGILYRSLCCHQSKKSKHGRVNFHGRFDSIYFQRHCAVLSPSSSSGRKGCLF